MHCGNILAFGAQFSATFVCVDSMLYFDHMPFTNSEKGFKLSTNGRPRICFLVALYGLAFIIPNIRWREQTPLF
jgi:hypothetical protein